jgi:mono/diheme cytochrome c family protein
MQDNRTGTVPSAAPPSQIAVSPDNPCPFLRGLVAGGYVDGHIVPLKKLIQTIEAASGKKGWNERVAGVKTCIVALIANGLSRVFRNWWSGPVLDQLRDGPLDKHGVGSRILNAKAEVVETEITRLADFGKDRQDPSGRMERGLTGSEITAFMDANFERAKDHRRPIDRKLMDGEWPVLLDVMGKGEGDARYLSVPEVRTLFVERRFPDRIVQRLSVSAPQGGILGKLVKATVGLVVLLGLLALVVIEFPNQVGEIVPPLAQILPPPLPALAPAKRAVWLDQNWTTADRHWFHHASQGTATFPVPYDWFMALEQPGIHLFTAPGLLSDSTYLERFGFLPSPRTVHADAASLRRFGYRDPPDPPPAPAPDQVEGLRPTAVENFDGLPVGFARLTSATNPGTGLQEPDQIGLTCAACHTGSIRYRDTSIRFDGGPAMVNLKKLELATGLAIAYTLNVPGRFTRFETRVLGPDAKEPESGNLKQKLASIGKFLLDQHNLYDKTIAGMKRYDGKHPQKDTEEGFGRLDALNRIGNQVFYTDFVLGGLSGFEKNLHAQDAPVSFPPIWTVPWFKWAQYDASIEQPLIRNAGEALGVSALVNFSPDFSAKDLFRSSVALENLVRIEKMLHGPDLSGQYAASFGGLQPPKWPSEVFPGDPLWKINAERVTKGRALYADMCVECHLGPVNDPVFEKEYPNKSIWSPPHWSAEAGWLDPVQMPVADMGTDSAQAEVLALRQVSVPGFLDMQPARDLGTRWECENLPNYSSTEMPFAIALMIAVDRTSQQWMDDHGVTDPKKLWGSRKNCPNTEPKPHHQDAGTDPKLYYRARPLNGVWATAPYLHNGSVPSLYWMLTPAAERPTRFCMGARDFDPEQVGFRVAGEAPTCKTGETLFSATGRDGPIAGNSVLGHSFEGTQKPYPNGVIGRTLTDDERYQLIEYLKTL